MPKHFFFDLDNTLTRSKSHIKPEHADVLRTLMEHADAVVVSGHGEKDIRAHLEDLAGYHILGQNGNRAVTKDGDVLWNHSLTTDEKRATLAFIQWARDELQRNGVVTSVTNEDDIVEDRDSQIAFSLIGHHEDRDKKEVFDPDFKKRRTLIDEAERNGELEKLTKAGVEARIAGTTNIDLFQLGKNKGYNIARLIEHYGWKKEDCIYVGDALFPGGNDETVIGVIPTHPVKDFHETYEYLESVLSS